METSLIFVIVGILIAALVSYALGVARILIGLVLLLWPRLRV